MAKRFTDSRKWDDPWLRKLHPKYKLLWLYMLDKCSHAGIWKVDFELAGFILGCHYEQDECFEVFSDRVVVCGQDTWYIPKFVTFQYGSNLNPDSKIHKSVMDELKNQRVSKPFGKGSITLMDKNKDKDKDNKGGVGGKPTQQEVEDYCKERKNGVDPTNFFDFYESKGWLIGKNPMKDWKAAVRTWEKRNPKKEVDDVPESLKEFVRPK